MNTFYRFCYSLMAAGLLAMSLWLHLNGKNSVGVCIFAGSGIWFVLLVLAFKEKGVLQAEVGKLEDPKEVRQMAHEHDRFLYEKNGFLHFGCINPFCGHGNPALPHHDKVPLDSQDVTMKLISHDDGVVTIKVTPKDTAYASTILKCEDNLEACRQGFRGLVFPKREGSGFTLVELLVVIAIIGVIAAVVVPTLLGFNK
ncbi:MAG: type II secretion system protein [Dehalococcoidales bacterium]|nr:type II secretion system protein [Dehalococcoidales bacterium]